MKKEPYGKKRNKNIYVYNRFKGVDYAHTPANISPQRCVDGINMVRSEVGKVTKRTGFEYDSYVWKEKINGIHFLQKDDERVCLIHCGTRFYLNDRVIYSQAADSFSQAVQLKDSLYILDSKSFMVFDGSKISNVKDNPFVPLTCTGRSPGGGGKNWQQPNILTDKRTEGFVSDGESTVYILSQRYISDDNVTVRIENDNGTQTDMTENHGFTVDRVAGTVTFETPPLLSKNTGKDNVYITYSKSTGADRNILDKCRVVTVFGAGGKPDTLFLSGHPDYPGREWFSQRDNPRFFSVGNTDLAGSDNSPVIGYTVKNSSLFVHRKDNERGLNIIVRQCNGGDEKYFSYPVSDSLQGPSAVAADTFVNMANDALFLTEKGIYAITQKDMGQDHYTQLRSLFINRKLLANKALSKAVATAYNDFYVLAVGSEIFLLDTLQKSYEEDKEYSNYQYECYHWKIEPQVRLLFVQDGRLCFATEDGRIGRFYTDYDNPESFNDNGKAIKAVWQTGNFTGDMTHRNKNIFWLWMVCATALRTGVRVQAQIKGVWTDLFSDMTTGRFFQWSAIQWSKFTWSTDKTPKLMKRTVRIRNVDKTAFRLENSEINEPFGLYELGFEYTTGSYYR